MFESFVKSFLAVLRPTIIISAFGIIYLITLTLVVTHIYCPNNSSHYGLVLHRLFHVALFLLLHILILYLSHLFLYLLVLCHLGLVLDVAKVVLDVAKVVLDVGKVVLDVGKVVLDGFQHCHHHRHLPVTTAF